MNITIISCSLHPQSRSYVLAQQIASQLQSVEVQTHNLTVGFHDLRDYSLDFCDGKAAYNTPDAQRIKGIISDSTALLLAMPVYNFDVNAAAKNLLELGLKAWNNKLVGFLCAAGGRNSYMSVLGIANSLMLDFRCLIIPRFVYATGSDFGDDRQETMYIASETVRERITELAATTVTLATALDSTYISQA